MKVEEKDKTLIQIYTFYKINMKEDNCIVKRKIRQNVLYRFEKMRRKEDINSIEDLRKCMIVCLKKI
jgi:hypothetical protein